MLHQLKGADHEYNEQPVRVYLVTRKEGVKELQLTAHGVLELARSVLVLL